MVNNSFLKQIINFLRCNIFIIFYIAVSFLMIFYHECWFDEANAYVIAKYYTIGEIFQYARYDGHPVLWHLLLKVTVVLKLPYVSMQVINTTFNSLSVWLLIRYSPFHRIYKYMIALGYFIFFEYNIVARNYSLLMLLLFLIAIIYELKDDKRYSYIILLLLLSFTHFFGLILSVLIFVYSVIKENLIRRSGWLIPNLIACLGYLSIAILLFRLPNDITIQPHLPASLGSILLHLNIIVNELLLVPYFLTSLKVVDIESFLKLLMSIFIFSGLIYYMIHKKHFIVLLLVYILIILVFRLFIYSGGIWNIGVIWLAIIFFSWISPNSKLKSMQLSFLSGMTIVILSFHIYFALESIYLDKNYSFSSSKKYASFINNYSKTHKELSLYFDFKDSWWGASIVPYLNDDIKVYGIELLPVRDKLNKNNCLVIKEKNAEIKKNEELLFSSSDTEIRGRCDFLILKINKEIEPNNLISP